MPCSGRWRTRCTGRTGSRCPRSAIELALRRRGPRAAARRARRSSRRSCSPTGSSSRDRTVQDAMDRLVAVARRARRGGGPLRPSRGARRDTAGSTRAAPRAPAAGRRTRRRRARAGTRRASSRAPPRPRPCTAGTRASAASRSGRPLARCGRSSTGRPPSASRMLHELLGARAEEQLAADRPRRDHRQHEQRDAHRDADRLARSRSA